MTEKVLNANNSVITRFLKAFTLQPIHLTSYLLVINALINIRNLRMGKTALCWPFHLLASQQLTPALRFGVIHESNWGAGLSGSPHIG